MKKINVVSLIIILLAIGLSKNIFAEDVSYSFNYGSNRNGEVSLSKGRFYEIHNAKGGCGGNDIAQCHYNRNGTIQAYYKDSCTTGAYGTSVTNNCSSVSAKGYTVRCCFTSKNVSYRFNYGSNRSGNVRLKKGKYYEIHNASGGCGGNDIAQCHYNSNGTIQAYYKDSCTTGAYGKSVSSGCSTSSAKGYKVSCCF